MADKTFEVHEHTFISGPRATPGYRKDQKWHDERKLVHSHAGGSEPHDHEHTGPACYAYRNPKFTAKPNGDQFDTVPLTEEENTFTLVVMDSALLSKTKGPLVPIGNTPIEALGFPAAERMQNRFRMKCVVRDERKGMKRA